MPRQNTHLYKHMDDLYPTPYIIQLSPTKRVKVYHFIGQRRTLYAPQFRSSLDSEKNRDAWHYFWTQRAAWATFSMDNALDKLQVERCGMWRVYYFNEIMTEVVDVQDMLSQKKPTARANANANGRPYEIIPLR